MRLSEVLHAIENGSTKTYRANYGQGRYATMEVDGGFPKFTIIDKGEVMDELTIGGCFSENCRLDVDWYPDDLIPVPWHEGFITWVMGEEKVFIYSDGDYVEPRQTTLFNRVQAQLIKWYKEKK